MVKKMESKKNPKLPQSAANALLAKDREPNTKRIIIDIKGSSVDDVISYTNNGFSDDEIDAVIKNLKDCYKESGHGYNHRCECGRKFSTLNSAMDHEIDYGHKTIAINHRAINMTKKKISETDKCPFCKSPDWEVRQAGVGHCNKCGTNWPLPYDEC